MERLRTPLFITALILVTIVVLAELGSTSLLAVFGGAAASSQAALLDNLAEGADLLPASIRQEVQAAIDEAREEEDGSAIAELQKLADTTSPGIAIRDMVLVDGVLLFTLALISAGLFLPEAVQGKVQGIITIIFALLLLLAAIGLLIAAVVKLLLMVGMLLAVPFGTLAYLAIYGSFPRGTAAAILGVLFTLKLLAAGSLVVAHQRFLQNKGLVLILLTTLLANIIITFLHGLVPIILVSISDAIAAIIMTILGIVWAVALLIGGVVSLVKTVTYPGVLPPRPGHTTLPHSHHARLAKPAAQTVLQQEIAAIGQAQRLGLIQANGIAQRSRLAIFQGQHQVNINAAPPFIQAQGHFPGQGAAVRHIQATPAGEARHHNHPLRHIHRTPRERTLPQRQVLHLDMIHQANLQPI